MTPPEPPSDERAAEAIEPGSPEGDGAARGADLVRAALARAKADARARAADEARQVRGAGRSSRASGAAVRNAGEPVAFGAAMREMLDERGWNGEAATARVLNNWEGIVGAEVAGSSRPVRLRHGELLIEADSTAWATQLRLLSRQLLDRIRADVGPELVTRLVVRGPTAPDWRHGRLRVPGRGPRDTYG